MPDRIDVFVSSTSRDLSAYRDAVTQVILRLGMYPIVMEAFNPTDRNAIKPYQDKPYPKEVTVGVFYGY